MANHQDFLSRYLACQEDLRAFVAGVVRDWHLADDVLQEVAMVCWRKYEQFDQSRSFGAWARGIAAKEILRQRSRWRRALPLLAPEAIAALDDGFAAEEGSADDSMEALGACLEHLDERKRELLRLRYGYDLPLDQVAQRTGRSTEAVGKAIQRLRSLLGDCVERQLNRGPA